MALGTDLNDDVLTEILLRLPPKSVLRSRAVCKHWRRAATSASFVAAYSRRRPLELILHPIQYGCRRGDQRLIDAVPLDDADGGGSRRLLDHGSDLVLFGSCDGLLLFWLNHKTFVICNPATRQRARFPALAPTSDAWVVPSGFYLHRPSGEHRVLCFAKETPPVHYVFSTGAAQPRRLSPFGEHRGGHPFPPCGVDVGGNLHWAHHPWTGKNSPVMLAFDTVTETFRRMRLPRYDYNIDDSYINLFDMRGTLAASAVGKWPYMDVWALDDYAGERWSRRFRVELPTVDKGLLGWKYGAAVAALENEMLVLFTFGGRISLYDVKEQRTVRVVRRGDNYFRMRRFVHVHRESLVPAVIDGQPCSSGVVPFSDQVKAEFDDIHYSLAET